MTDFAWTKERVAQLRELHAEGLSFNEIAGKLGCESRNACIGKARRIGLGEHVAVAKRQRQPHAGQEQKSARKPKQTTPQKSGPVPVLTRQSRRHPTDAIPPLPTQHDGANVPIEQRRTLLQLNNHVCKWPFGSPGAADFFFCGGDAEAGRPYCKPHCNIAYVPSRR